MLKERTSRFSRIFATFFQCYFISETQVLMTVSDFLGFFLRIISWKAALLFNGERLGALVLMGVGIFKKYHMMERVALPPSPIMRNHDISVQLALKT